MSYGMRIDDMVGHHVAEFQRELSLAKQLEGHKNPPPMPYGPEGGDCIPVKPVKEGETGAIGWLWHLLFGAYGSTCAARNEN